MIDKNIIWLKKIQDDILKKRILKWQHIESTRVNFLNFRFGSWDQNNPQIKQIKTNYKTQFLINSLLNDEIEKKIQYKKMTQ